MQTRRTFKIIKFLVFSLIALFVTFGLLAKPANAQGGTVDWLAFGPETEGNLPQLEMLSASAESIVIKADLPGVAAGVATIGGLDYLTLTGEGYYQTNQVGSPSLPVLRKMIEVPLEAKVTLELIQVETQTVDMSGLGLNGLIAPVQEGQPKCGGPIPASAPNMQVYGGGLYPNEQVEIINDFIIRGHRIIVVEVRPVRYDATIGELETASSMSFRLNLEGSDMALTRSEAQRLNSQAFNHSLESEVLNFNQGEPVAIPNTNERILIITADMFQSAMQRFVDLKTGQGFQVNMVNLTTVGGNTTSAIRAYILAQYNGANPPDYVILVGDYISGDPVGSITNWPFRTSGGYRTDLHYYTMDSDSEFTPDVLGARFPVRTLEQLNAMIDKYEAYDDVSGAEAWVKKAEFLASNDSSFYHVAEGSHNFVIDSFTLPRGYTGIFPTNPQPGGDKIYAITYGGTGAHAVASMNDNRALLLYSGHGAETFWDAPRVTQSDVRNMTGVAIPYVASHACITADFNTGEAFSDTWVMEPINGALTFFGASNNSYWPEDDTLERNSMTLLFSDPEGLNVPSVGTFTNHGMLAVAASGSGRTNYYWEEYHVFGDPTLVVVQGPKYPDFRVNVDPTELKVCNASTSTAVVNLPSINDFTNPVNLSASDVPGFEATFTRPVLSPPGSTNVTITGDGTAQKGTATMQITGRAGELVHSADLTLNIFPPIQVGPTLKTPADQARDQSQKPTFSWTESVNAETYQIQISKDPNFTEIVIDKSGIVGGSYLPVINLVTDTQYYWRVTAENVCGKVVGTQVYTFRTKAGPGDCALGTIKNRIAFNDFEAGVGAWQNPPDQNYPTFKFDISTVSAYSPQHSILAQVPDSLTDQRLISPVFSIPNVPDPVSLIFWHKWSFDHESACNDAGILEFSTDGGRVWNQVAKSYLLTSPYNGVVKTGVTNPLAGKNAWCFQNDEWVKTVVELGFLKGKDVQFRYRLASGFEGAAEGWYIDDILLQSCVPGVNEFKLFLPALASGK